MNENVMPVVKGLYVCDDVWRNPTSGKVNITGLLASVRPPAGKVYPYQLGQLVVFTLLSGGIRPARLRVQIVHSATGLPVYDSPEQTLHFPERRLPVEVAYRILKLTFPVPGEYMVELWCDGRFIEDRLLRLIPAEESEHDPD